MWSDAGRRARPSEENKPVPSQYCFLREIRHHKRSSAVRWEDGVFWTEEAGKSARVDGQGEAS